MPVETVACDDIGVVLRFINDSSKLSGVQRRDRVRQWEERLTDPAEAGCARLHLAVLFNVAGGTARDWSRAREFLREYLGTDGRSDGQLDLARYLLAVLDEREHCLKSQQQERRARVLIEEKLEALKAIELRMNDTDRRDTMPLPGS